MRPVKCWLWSRFRDCCWCQRIQPYVSGAHKTDAGAAACLTHITAGSSFCSQPDRLHQLYKRCFYFILFLKGGEEVFSLWNDPKMLWFWDKQLCQRVSIKNLYATARLWSSRREGERFHLQRADANDQQTRELWMYLSYFTSLIATGTAHQIFNICLLVIKICILPLQAFINHFEAFLWKHANISKTLNPLMPFILHFNRTTHWYWWISHDRVWNTRKVQHIYLRRRTRKHLPVKKMNNKYPRKTNCLFLNYFLFTLDDE